MTVSVCIEPKYLIPGGAKEQKNRCTDNYCQQGLVTIHKLLTFGLVPTNALEISPLTFLKNYFRETLQLLN